MTLLAMADPKGMIRASLSGIARRAVVSEQAAEKALAIFQAPDPDSKNQDRDGRRIERVDGGWFLYNYGEYREIRTQEQLANAERQRKFRKSQRAVTGDVTDVTRSVTPQQAEANAEAEAEADVKVKKETTLVGLAPDGGTSVDLVVKTNGNGLRPRTHDEIKAHLATFLGEVQAGRQQRLKTDEVRAIMAELVFAYWQAKRGHEGARLDDTRLNKLKKCLKENGDNIHELLYAIDGWELDPTFKKQAAEGQVLDGIDNIFKNRERIERLAGHCRSFRAKTPHSMAVKYLDGAAV